MPDNISPTPWTTVLRELMLNLWHCVLAIYAALLVVGTLSLGFHELGAPGSPVVSFWITIAVGTILAAAMIPPLFNRLPRTAQILAQVGVLIFVALPITTLTMLDNAWSQTPQGVAEARELASDAASDAAADAQRAGQEAQLRQEQEAADRQQQATKDAQEQQAKVERCFSYFGHRLPKLEKEVKSGLGNPDAFKQLQTETMPTDADGYNVIMTFMAQNRMGALWKFDLRATVDRDTCDVTKIEPEPSES